MVCDAFVAADPILKISDKIADPQEYLFLDDGILKDIARSRDPVSGTLFFFSPHLQDGYECSYPS